MINTLIVDDSALVRQIIRDFLESDGNFRIIAEAADGEDGIQKILSLNPDLVTLDIEMPKKNGLEVIEAVMKETPVPIVVITSHDTAKTAYEAALKGALEFYAKDIFTASLSPEKRQEILETLKRISSVKAFRGKAVLHQTASTAESLPVTAENNFKEIIKPPDGVRAVIIASSTGGPKALSAFFSLLPADFPVPVVIVQHNSSGFDKSFTQWLANYTSLNVKIAEEREVPIAGTVYISKTDKHLELRSHENDIYLCYNNNEPENNQKPAADVLFRTAAESLKQSVISVVLTGMGSDGAAGTVKIHEMGGITLAQDEESSLIYGMPKAAAETGCVDKVLPLEMIPGELYKLVK
ncbi:MAG: chemotaxis-specific protein-glutamate methyltransferase CheB [Treponema sp.]|jgi:two-component system chemotaxis response regulator CheB|nr:chemotaxis-specific protein-glutamate methyltransferase CheB [Treponema sp.]